MVKYFSVILYLVILNSCASVTSPENIKNAEAHNSLGYSYLNGGQLNEAFIAFQKALEFNPKNKEALYNLGYISVRFKEYDKAISYYKRAISIDPNYSEAINNLCVTYAETGQWDKAIEHFKAALRNPLYRTPAQAYSNLGYAYYKKGDYASAENALRDALIRNPVLPSALYILGLVYVKTDNDTAAIEEFKKAIGILTDYTDAHWELANVYLRQGKNAKALKHLKVIVEKDDNTERIRKASEYIEQLKY